MQDVLARDDVNIGRLIDAIEAQVGAELRHRVLSDHGVALVPEQVTAEGGDAGRISTPTIRNAVNAAVEKVLGTPGPHVAAVYDSQVALTPGVFDLLRQKPGGLAGRQDRNRRRARNRVRLFRGRNRSAAPARPTRRSKRGG